MSLAEPGHRPLGAVVRDILQRAYLPPVLRSSLESMAERGWIEDDHDYWGLAKVKCALMHRRSHSAARLVHELGDMLAAYRTDRW